MSIYAIGDVQGCFSQLQQLLELIRFDPLHDRLWFTGDLVNRGPQSLMTLRFVKTLVENQQAITVLGNHDLHLLARAMNAHTGWPEDTLSEILQAPDGEELINWLSQQPLLHYDESTNFILVHAGLAAQWDITTAKKLALEVEATLQSSDSKNFLHHMYGDQPNQWDDSLKGWERLRCITNYLTRARFCHPDGSLELTRKGKMTTDSQGLIPWFKLPHLRFKDNKVLFGHWAALGGITHTPNIFALDTGCVWGYCLTAMRLDNEKRYQIACARGQV